MNINLVDDAHIGGRKKIYKNNGLLEYLRRFYREKGRSSPMQSDFNNNTSKLFNLIARASFYRATTGMVEELYPEDLDIGEHIKSSKNFLVDKALKLTSRLEEDCECNIRR